MGIKEFYSTITCPLPAQKGTRIPFPERIHSPGRRSRDNHAPEAALYVELSKLVGPTKADVITK